MRPENPITRLLLVLAQVICAAVVLSALGVAAATIISRPVPWFLLGFELVMVVAGCTGFQTARGRHPQGPALALICVAGIIAAGSFLGYLGAGRKLMGVNLKVFVLARVAAGGFLAVVAAWLVLSRRPGKSIPLIGRGILFGVVAAAIAGAIWFGWAATGGLGEVLRLVLGVVLSAVSLGFIAASVHCLIRAFEFGRLSAEESGPASG